MNNNIILEAQSLVKQFGGLIAVNYVSVKLYEGEILGLIGANGAGKTTLFNMLSGVFEPTSGKILFENVEIQKKPAYKICEMGIGRTYQIVQPFTNLTVLENTMVGALLRHRDTKVAREKAEEILELIGLSHLKDTVGSSLNIPQLKRMEMARALATEPKILLLDEVMAGLNPTEGEMIINLILKIRDHGVSIIVIEHVMKAIMNLSDRIYVLNQGELIAEGTPQEVSNDEEVIKSYLGEKKYVKS
ncbi:MAG: ABC transporter ATP-binding protein [Saccharofermentanales bacterium]|jgi:branched-chain amino acid transport system ATP-binding protein